MPKKNPEVLHWNAGSPLFCCGFLGLGFGGIKMVTGADGLYVPWLFWDKQTVPRSWGGFRWPNQQVMLRKLHQGILLVSWCCSLTCKMKPSDFFLGGKWQKKGQGIVGQWVEVVTWLHSIQWLCCGILEWTTGPSIILLHFLGIYGSRCHLHF